MPNDLLPRVRRRRIAALAAAVIGAALLPATILTSTPATAANPCAPAGYTATSSADLLKLNLLDIGPLGLVHGPLAAVTIGHATADMAHANPKAASATADYLSAKLAGLTVPASLLNTHASQTAPPAHAAPDAHSLLKLNTGLLNLGVGNVSASAGANGPYTCGIANGDASIADATVLAGLPGHSLLALPMALNGNAGAGVITAGGHLASKAGADAGVAELDLLSGSPAAIKVKVVTEPTLVGIAGGSVATSSVSYTSPILDVTLPGGKEVTIDNEHANVAIGAGVDANALTGLLTTLHLPALPSLSALKLKKTQIEVRLSIGELTKTISATSVSGSAATLRLQILVAPLGTETGILSNLTTGGKTLLDLGIGELHVAATAPARVTSTPPPCGHGYGCNSTPPCKTGGYGYGSGNCASPSPSPSGGGNTPGHSKSPSPSATPTPSSSVAGTTSGKLPLTGSDTALYAGGGVLLLVLGRFLLVVTRRRHAGML